MTIKTLFHRIVYIKLIEWVALFSTIVIQVNISANATDLFLQAHSS